MAIRVVVVDGHTLTRFGLTTLAAAHPDLEVVAEAGTAAEAASLIASMSPDVVTVAVGLPDADGLRLARELRDRYPSLGIVVLTSQGEDDVLFRALGLVGTPYRYGGNTPDGGFDCSGLVNYVYRDSAGLGLPRSSRDMAALDVPRIERRKLQSGDLIFFGARDVVTHVAIYVGENRFVHAPNTGGTVRLDDLDGPYWKDRYLFAKRVLR